MNSRVFIPDSDGGQYVECPAALSAHLDHLEQRANGAELALLKAQRMPKDPTDTIVAEIAHALRIQYGSRAASPEQIVAFIVDMLQDAGWRRMAAADPVEIHAETLIALVAWCASDPSDDVAAAAAEVRAFVAAANGEHDPVGPDDPADLNPEPMNAPHVDSVRNENGSHR